ncbi:50S ribosomal protein L30 [Gammaproteobacteria bacterium]|nr:50S ribosomal protein L30 [Gammaproteobacteria bacterium]
MSNLKKIKVTLKKSSIGTLPAHKGCVKGLGLKKLNQTVEVIDTPCNRGMINKVSYLLLVEDV